MGLPKRDWKKYAELANAGLRGWNPLNSLPRIIREEFPDFNHFDFHFCSLEDLPEMQSIGWFHMEPKHFGGDESLNDFNNTVGLRFGIINDANGHLRYRENFLLIKEKELAKIQMDARHQAHEDEIARTLESQIYVPPQDPRAAEMKDAALEFSSHEVHRVQAGGTPSRDVEPEKPKRGRPKKTEK